MLRKVNDAVKHTFQLFGANTDERVVTAINSVWRVYTSQPKFEAQADDAQVFKVVEILKHLLEMDASIWEDLQAIDGLHEEYDGDADSILQHKQAWFDHTLDKYCKCQNMIKATVNRTSKLESFTYACLCELHVTVYLGVIEGQCYTCHQCVKLSMSYSVIV